MDNNNNDNQIVTLKKIAYDWQNLAIRPDYEDFNYDRFIYLFNKTYNIFKFFSTRSFIDRALVGLYVSVQTFFGVDGSGTLLEHACKTIAMTMAQETMLPCEPCSVAPEGNVIRCYGKEFYVDYNDIKGSISRYMEFVENHE